MAINLSDNIHASAPKPVESKYLNITLPYTTCAQVNTCIPAGERYTGLTVNILGTEYWYKTGVADACLVNKSGGGGTITGATNGLSTSGANIALGGTLCCNTQIGGIDTYDLNLITLKHFNLGFNDISTIMDNGNHGGIRYGADYSSTYNIRSLVDKGYVDTIATGLNIHAAVLVATTVSITLSGTSQTIDGVPVTSIIGVNNRILIKNQISGATNGIYSASTGTWGRTSDYYTNTQVTNGDLIPIISGSTQNSSIWALVTSEPITVGVTPLNFIEFSTVIDITAGQGIAITQVGGVHTVCVKLGTNSGSGCGLAVDANGLCINNSIAGTALSYSAGAININAANCGVVGAISVGYNAGNCLVVACTDIAAVIDTECYICSAINGLTKVGDNAIKLGGTITGITTISDSRLSPAGIEYGANYSATYTARSLVDCAFVTSKTSGATNCASLSVYAITGDSTNTGFTITHNKNKTFVAVEVIKNTSPYPTIYTSVSRPTTNTVCVTFDTAPLAGQQYKILITS
jgi:hypothetical protein